ncbi:MAG: diguanylate cyclase [Magnetococcales bacterium]|nr:diguanylate cyclase [Magnetococcales bacterium]
MIELFQTFSSERIQDILHQLDLALWTHHDWLSRWNRAMVCQEPLQTAHMDGHAHRRCAFGSWFYGEGADSLEETLIFKDIELIHRKMHAAARDLALQAQRREPITPDEYDEVLHKQAAFRWMVGILEQQLKDALIQIDPLTRILNRQKMLPFLEHKQKQLSVNSEPCALALADLDYFKRVNDNYGHQAGDHVLSETAQFFACGLRSTSLVFRYGGEEFLLYLPDASLKAAERTLDRLREGLASRTLTLPDGQELKVTASFGVVLMDRFKSVEQTIEMADQALYAAKEGGRNRVMCADIG